MEQKHKIEYDSQLRGILWGQLGAWVSHHLIFDMRGFIFDFPHQRHWGIK